MSLAHLNRLLGPMALLVAIALVITLGLQKRSLRIEYMELLERERLPYEGLWVPTLEALTLKGEPVVIGRAEEGERQVLLLFNTTCPFCRTSLPAWEDLSARLARIDEPRVHVYGVSLSADEETRRYVYEHGLTFPVFLFPEPKLRVLYRAGGVPLIMVLDQEGRVTYTRKGELQLGAPLDSAFAAAVGFSDRDERTSAGDSIAAMVTLP